MIAGYIALVKLVYVLGISYIEMIVIRNDNLNYNFIFVILN